MKQAKLALALGTLIVLNAGWAVPLSGAAHSFATQSSRNSASASPWERRRPRLPAGKHEHQSFSEDQLSGVGRNGRRGRLRSQDEALLPIRLWEDRNAGLLVTGWVNGAGPFTFAIDTGAGASIVSSKVVSAAGLRLQKSSRTLVGGLSTSRITSNDEIRDTQISLGVKSNMVPGKPTLAVVQTLPGAIDGILDPTEIFGRLAYSIDLPNRQLLAFDSRANGLDLRNAPKDGAIVRWVRESGSDRPFVKLGDGRLALLDTGSGFGLAVSDSQVSGGRNHQGRHAQDLGGGSVQSRQLAPTTVSIGDLVLRGVPTDVLMGVAPGTPLILGRRALFPFKITFEPVSRLIIFEPTLRD